MSDLLQKSISKYPCTERLHSYLGAAHIIAAGNGQEITVYKNVNGINVPLASGVATCTPSLSLDIVIGAGDDFFVCVEGVDGDCLQLSVIDSSFTITPPIEIGDVNVGDIEMGDVTVINDCDNPVGVEVCGVDVVDCGTSTGAQAPIMQQVTQAGPSNAVFPPDYVNGIDSGGGRPFGGFPFTDFPSVNNKGYTFSEPFPAQALPSCSDATVDRVYFEVVIQQDVDNDGADFGDQISSLVTPADIAIPTSGTTTSGVTNSLVGFIFFDPTDGEVTTFTLEATSPEALSFQDAADSNLAFATQAGDTTTILGVCKVIEYSLGDSCALQSLSTKECNSDAHLTASNSLLNTSQAQLVNQQQSTQLVLDISQKVDDLIVAVQSNQPVDYTAQISTVIASLQSIDADTTAIESALSAVGTNTQNTIVELQNTISVLQNVDANTDTVEQALTDILAAIPAPATVESYGNQVLSSGESFTAPAGAYSIRVTPEPGNTFDFAGLDENFNAWSGSLAWGNGQRPSSNSDSIVITASGTNSGRILVHWEI